MPIFQLEKVLPPLLVSKDLLRSLQQYLLAKSESLRVNDERRTDAPRVTVTIEDDFGTLSIDSIDEHAPNRFSDSTSRIKVELDGSYPTWLPGISIAVTFRVDDAKVRVRCDRLNAKELALGLFHGIEECVRPYARGPAWTFYTTNGGFVLSIVGVTMLGPGILMVVLHAGTPFAFLAVAATSLMTVFFVATFRPYTQFDTLLAERRGKWGSWAFFGILSWFIFSVALQVPKDYILALFHFHK